MVEKIEKTTKNIMGKTIAIPGLAFKAETDGIREAPSIVIIEELYQIEAKIKTFNPKAIE